MAPTTDAFGAHWPTARPHNLLDDSLLADLEAAGHIDAALRRRFADLVRYARRAGAVGVLFTCSAFGEAIDHAAQLVDIPVAKPNDAMFEAALELGVRNILLATSPTAAASLETEYRELAGRRGVAAHLEVIVVSAARVALQEGDPDGHDRLLAQRAAQLSGRDAIMLAHFSTARAAASIRLVTDVPVLSAPESAVILLRRRLEASADCAERS